MKAEPPIDRARLTAAVRAQYGVTIDDLRFVPIGWVANGYEVTADDGCRYFLKIWPDTEAGRRASQRLPIILPMLSALHERGVFRRVPAPIPTRSETLLATFAGQPMALFAFLPGQSAPPNDSLPPLLLDEMARTIAAIHQSTPAIAAKLPRDALDVPFASTVRDGLAALDVIGSGNRPGLRALRDGLSPRRAEVLDQLTELERLGTIVRGQAPRLVLCHTDIGGDNLRLYDDGRFAVLDWDDATLAPPEFDLWDFVGPAFSRFARVYRQCGGAWPLDVDRLAFALMRRHLGDFVARLSRLLQDTPDEDEEREALEGIDLWGFDQWRRLDGRLKYAKAAIGQA